MAYPENLLSQGEQVVVHKHTHWKMLLVPILALIVVLGAGITLVVLAQDTAWKWIWTIAIAAVAVVLIVWLFLIPFVRWRTTHFVITTDRVMYREGVMSRHSIDIPLSRISSVRFEQGLLDRIVACGTLIIESSSQEPLTFDDIPNVEKVHTLLYREVNDNPYDDFARGGDEQPAGQQPTQQLTREDDQRGRRGR